MMAGGTNIACPTCGSVEQEEIDGIYFCSTCNTQIAGITAQVTEGFIDVPAELRREVKTKKAREKKHKTPDTGINWTTFEAFNIILIKQVTFLTEIYEGVDMRLKDVVLGLWTSYLEKIEAGFMDGFDKKPLLSNLSRKRDEAIIAAGVEKLPLPVRQLYGTRCADNHNSRVRAGSKVLINTRVDDVYHPIQGKKCPGRRSKKSSSGLAFSSISRKKKIVEKFFAPEVCDSSDDEIKPGDLSSDDEDEDYEEEDSQTDEDDYDPRVYKVPKNKLNKISRKIRKEMGDDYFESRYAMSESPHGLDSMSMTKTICFIYTALRIMNEDVFISDLINWIDSGHFPFFAGTRLLPEKWVFTVDDVNTFHPVASPDPHMIIKRSAELMKFLDVPIVPPADMIKIIKRYLHELNLPQDILKFITRDEEILRKIQSLGCCGLRKKDMSPFYEQRAAIVILVVLRKLFGLDVQKCNHYSQLVKDYGAEDAFNWNEWEAHTRIRMEMISCYFTPVYRVSSGQMKDVNVACDFFSTVADGWRPHAVLTTQPSKSNESEYRTELRRRFEKDISHIKEEPDTCPPEPELISNDPDDKRFIQFPKASLNHWTDATNFVISRLNDDQNDLKDKLRMDFRNKSLAHFREGSPYILRYEPISSMNKLIIESLPEPIQLLLSVFKKMLRYTDYNFKEELRRVEKLLFFDHRVVIARHEHRRKCSLDADE